MGEDSCVHRQNPCTGIYPCPSRATDVSIGPYPLSRVKRNLHALACVKAHWCCSMPSGWLRTSGPWRRNSGHSSRKCTPWWASDTAPGIGTWPPPINPTAEMPWFHTDQYDASKGVMPAERYHALTKYARQAPHLEHFNHTLRQRLSRLVRGTFSFPSNEPTTWARERISSTTIIS